MCGPALFCLGCYNKSNIDWVTYKQQKFISHSFGGWEVLDQGAGEFNVWCRPASWFIVHGWLSSHCILRWPKGQRSSLCLFYKDANVIHAEYS